MAPYARVVATGSYVPDRVVTTRDLAAREFRYKGQVVRKTEEEILKATGGMRERRWCAPGEGNVDMGAHALRRALAQSPGPVDLLLMGHNSGVPVPPVSAVVQSAARYQRALAFDMVTDGEAFDVRTAARIFVESGRYARIVATDSPAVAGARSPEEIPPAERFSREAALYSRGAAPSPAPFRDGAAGEAVDGVIVGHPCRNGSVSRARRIADAVGLGPSVRTADIGAGCPAFITALNLAARAIEIGRARRVAVLGAEKLTEFADPDHLDITLYGDAAGAVILEASDTPGILDSHFVTIGDEWHLLKLGEGVIDKSREWLVMEGHEVFRRARSLPEIMEQLARRAGVRLDDVRLFFIHQMNGRILNYAARKIVPEDKADAFVDEKIPWTLDLYSNNGAATIPLTLDMVLRGTLARRDSKRPFGVRLGDGSLVMFVSIGAGMILGANLLRL